MGALPLSSEQKATGRRGVAMARAALRNLQVVPDPDETPAAPQLPERRDIDG